MNEIAVYTAITGNRDPLMNEQITNGADFICFTDDSSLSSDTWQIKKACDLFNDPNRNAKIHKILAHKYLNKYKYVIWMDANIALIVPAKTLVDRYLQRNNIALFKHNTGRDCIYEEADICINLKLDNLDLIRKQVAHYREEGYPEHNGLFECTILLRKNCEEVRRFNNFWWGEICRRSKRDQISFNYLLHKLGIKAGTMAGNIIDNKYFLKTLHPRPAVLQKNKIFKFRNKEYRYIDMAYNYTSLNERRIELPIAFKFVDNSDKNVIEIGNVLRHYRGDYFYDVLDLNEKSLWPTIKEDVFQWKPIKKYSVCISISTIEHTSNPLLAVQRILTFAPRVLITFPIGQNCEVNKILDRLENVYFMKRINNENEWIEITKEEARKMKYNIPFKWANAIAILIKDENV